MLLRKKFETTKFIFEPEKIVYRNECPKKLGGKKMKGQAKYLVLVAVIALLVSGCTLFGKKTGNVTVKIVFGNDDPVSNLELTLKSSTISVTAKTGADGKAKFQVEAVGENTLEGELVLYDGTKEIISKKVNIVKGDNPEIVHKLTTIGKIDVSVVDLTNKPISNSELKVSIGEQEKVLTLGESGKMQLYAKTGTYVLLAKSGIYESDSFEVKLDSQIVVQKISFNNTPELALKKKYETINVKQHDSYGDPNLTELTDGVLGNTNDVEDPTWFGAAPIDINVDKISVFIIDLEKVENIGTVRVQTFQQVSWGVRTPVKMVVEVSNDKSNWSEPVVVEKVPSEEENEEVWYEMAVNAEGRYVKVSVQPVYTWFWLGEISVRRPEVI